MVSDSEPRYRLVDSQGNTVGTLYAKSGGTLALQEGSSGSDNEIELQTDGTLQTDSLNTGPFAIGQDAAIRRQGANDGSRTDIDHELSETDAIRYATQATTVDDTITTILTATGGRIGAFAFVSGYDGVDTFADEVLVRNGNITTRLHPDPGPTTRTYSWDVADNQLELSLSSGDQYSVFASGFLQNLVNPIP